jgi:hypothetical protein
MVKDEREALLALHRKISRKIESGRGVMLSAEELSAFVAVGAFATVAAAATEYQVKRCQERSARSRSINAAHSVSTTAPAETISKLSGTTSVEIANEALAQAQAICRLRS